MFPVIFSIGPFTFYTLAPFVCLAIFAGFFIVWRRAKELHYEEKEVFDVVIISLFWMFVLARLGYVLIHITDYWWRVWEWVNIFGRPGWYFPAGLIGGGVAAYRQAVKRKWDPYQLLDVLVTGLVLSQAILAFGSWISGIGYGIPTTSFLGMKFAGVYDKRYPIQLLEFIGFAGCFFYLWWAEGTYRTFGWYRRGKSQASSGFLVAMYLIWSGILLAISTMFKTPTLQLGPIRFDVIIPIIGGIVCGGWILLNRSGVAGKDIWTSFLDYFGLRKRAKRPIPPDLRDTIL